MKDSVSMQIQADRLGPPGILGELVILDIRADETRSDQERLSDTSPRQFIVTAKLSRQPLVGSEISAEVDADSGGSYFLAKEDAKYTKIYTPGGALEVHHNASRELSVMKLECVASSTSDAKSKFHEFVVPFLDYLSFRADVPLHIPTVVCEDVKNELRSFNYVGPYGVVTVNPHEKHLKVEMFPIYALYREAKNSSSHFYAYMCYYKILEGIYKHLRESIFKRAKQAGVALEKIKERVPAHAEIDQAMVGQPINNLYTTRFQKQFRDRVAHYVLDSGSVLNVSSYEESLTFAKDILLLQLCCRVAIETQESYLNSVP